jgi:hypothetical protein
MNQEIDCTVIVQSSIRSLLMTINWRQIDRMGLKLIKSLRELKENKQSECVIT